MKPIYVLYGTETLNSEELAERTGEAITGRGLPVEVLDMEDFDVDELATVHTLLIITSTFGAGEPPGNAEEFHEYVMEAAPSLPHLRFSVCGLGDTAYDDFCQCGIEFDARLEALGGRRIVPRVDCDLDYEPTWEAWLAQVLTALGQLDYTDVPGQAAALELEETEVPEQLEAGGATLPLPMDDTYRAEPTSSVRKVPKKKTKKTPLGSRKNPFIATVLANRNLNGDGSLKETRHVEFSLDGCEVEYKVGDALGLFPRNCPDLVRRILRACSLQGDEPVDVRDEYITVRDALIYRCDIVTLDKRLFDYVTQGPMRAMFRAIVDDPEAKKAYLSTHHVIDILSVGRIRIEAQQLVDFFKTLVPRLYSISSSPKAHPNEVHLTVDVVRYEMHGLHRKGVASTFLAERSGRGVQIPVYIKSSKSFGLVEEDEPIIMIGPGTGIAPFRAFLEEREARGSLGYSWLFFGARYRKSDYLYEERIDGWLEKGVLTRLDLAFSRDQEEKIYVQDRMWENGADFYAWLEADAYVYICGDASRMAKDVHATMRKIIMKYGQVSEEQAEARLKKMAAEGRYERDVY